MPFVSAAGDDGGKEGFASQDGGRRGEEVIRRPSLDSEPGAVHASGCGQVRGEEIGLVGEYGKEKAMSDAVV